MRLRILSLSLVAGARARRADRRIDDARMDRPHPRRARATSSPARRPRPSHDYLGESGPAAVQQSASAPVNTALDGKQVKIPGFIVPLDVAKDGTVSEFFLRALLRRLHPRAAAAA